MPNWASVTYECVGDSKHIGLLHEALKYIDSRKTSLVPNGFGKWWLGNLVTRLGGNWEDYPCRGDITCYSFGEVLFQLFLLIVGIFAYSWIVSSFSN